MRFQQVFTILCLSTIGCNNLGSTTQFLLKSPIQEQCNSSGLKACDKISDGIISYIDGDSKLGQQNLQDGLHQNCDKVSEFKQLANTLETLGYLPYAKQYITPLKPVIKFIQDESQRCLPESGPTASTYSIKDSQINAPTIQHKSYSVPLIQNPYNDSKCENPFYLDSWGIKHMYPDCKDSLKSITQNPGF